MILIETPSPFATKAEWQAFLEDMQALLHRYPHEEDITAAISQAQAALCA